MPSAWLSPLGEPVAVLFQRPDVQRFLRNGNPHIDRSCRYRNYDNDRSSLYRNPDNGGGTYLADVKAAPQARSTNRDSGKSGVLGFSLNSDLAKTIFQIIAGQCDRILKSREARPLKRGITLHSRASIAADPVGTDGTHGTRTKRTLQKKEPGISPRLRSYQVPSTAFAAML